MSLGGVIIASDGDSAAGGGEPTEITHGIDLTPSDVGIAGAGYTESDLTSSSSHVKSQADGEIIEFLNVDTGLITIEHDNVTVRYCRVVATSNYGLVVAPGVTGAQVEFVDVIGSISAAVYLQGEAELRRVRVEQAVDSIKVGSNQRLIECYVSNNDTQGDPDAHLDCVQSVGGSNVVLERCYLRLNTPSGDGLPNGCLQWDANFAELSDYTAEDCYFWGAPQSPYPVRITTKDSQPTGNPSNITVTGCIWEDGAWTSGPYAIEQGPGWVWSNNTTTTGTPVTI